MGSFLYTSRLHLPYCHHICILLKLIQRGKSCSAKSSVSPIVEYNLGSMNIDNTNWYTFYRLGFWEFVMQFVLIALITMILICTISLPLHVFIRKLSFKNTATNLRFWVSTLFVSILVAFLVSLSDS